MASKQQILINLAPEETRVAIIKHGVVDALFVERNSASSLVGNIYKAKVTRVIPGMQAAFIDVGLEKNGFLHIDDILKTQNISPKGKNVPLIQDRLHQGESIWVQVSKDPYSDKGARLTTGLSISARKLVYLPLSKDVAISQKISSMKERSRLVDVVNQIQIDESIEGGFIIRTSAESIADNELRNDMLFLQKTWNDINKLAQSTKSISLLHKDASLLIRTLRDTDYEDVENIWIDSQEGFHQAKNFLSANAPEYQSKLSAYDDAKPLFDLYSVEQQIQAALQPEVTLKSGGHIIIDQTAAMTVIDVNTGSYLGKNTHSDTVLETNIEAADEIVRQIKLRNLSGIIIIDFIDMIEQSHQNQILNVLEIGFANGTVKTTFSGFSQLGLIEISRQRVGNNLEHIMCEKCNVCEGSGSVKANETICYDILRDILHKHRQLKSTSYTVTASSAVIELLKNSRTSGLIDVKKLIKSPINLNVDQHYHQQYQITLN